MLDRDALRAVLAPITEARTFPARAYTDPAWFEFEIESLFARDGFAAASADDVARPGEWARVPLAGDRRVVARDESLELALLRDACRHRGAALFDGDAGVCEPLAVTCPYHGWRYALSGALLRAPGACANFDPAAHGLAAGAAWEDGPLVFAGERRGESRWSRVPWLERVTPPSLRRARRVVWEVAANWKLLVENFQESHHFPSVHPWLEARTPWKKSHSVTDGDAWLGGRMDLAADTETVSTTGLLRGRHRIAPASLGARVHDAWIAPNVLTSLQPDYLLTYRLHPLAAGCTRVVGEVYAHPATRDDDGMDEIHAFWDRTNAEDRAVCERQQAGLTSRWPGGVYCSSEDGAHAFDRWVARRLLRALEEDA